jgi:hypothetical protein
MELMQLPGACGRVYPDFCFPCSEMAGCDLLTLIMHNPMLGMFAVPTLLNHTQQNMLETRHLETAVCVYRRERFGYTTLLLLMAVNLTGLVEKLPKQKEANGDSKAFT